MSYEEILKEAQRIREEMARLVADLPPVRCAYDAVKLLAAYAAEDQEVFGGIVLNARGKVLAIEEFHRGGVSEAAVDMKIVVKRILRHPGAACIIFFHNHPSGEVSPSLPDENLTRGLCAAMKVLDIDVLDHIIIGAAGEGYYSFQESGKLPDMTVNQAIEKIYNDYKNV